ncbi:MAG TPA: anti-sigma factor [Gemmatimonadales bacterium]|nr:anti-sigma factor [Gemmatimonadales bacterium]
MSGHESLKDQVAAFALGSLPDDEHRFFLEHLRQCAECRAEVQALAAVTGLLGLSAPDAEPPAGLRDRVLARVGGARPVLAGRAPRSPAWLATAAAIAVAAVSTIWAAIATGRADRAERQLGTASSRLAELESTTAALVGRQVHMVSLAAPGQRPALRVIWNHDRNTFLVIAASLPAAPAGRTYQLWAIAAGRSPVSMGTFKPNADGTGTAVLPVSEAVTALGFIDQCGLTLEPEGGSPQPTETPRLIGTWSHLD